MNEDKITVGMPGDELEPIVVPDPERRVHERPLYDAQRRFLGLTKIGWLNLLVMQWFGTRLHAEVDRTERGDEIVCWGVRWALPLRWWRLDYRIASVAWLAFLLALMVL